MTTCIYTGAYVYITNYGAHAPADIYRAGDSLVLRINGEEGWTYKNPRMEPTHILTLSPRESMFFWPFDTSSTFTAVVPLDACPRTPYARPVLEDE